jgi:sulfur relay protein TusB/DsrH
MILYQCTSTSPGLLALVSQADAIVFRQDGVYLLQTEQQWPTAQLYALQQDCIDRQLQCPGHVQLLSDAAWVELCLKAQQVLLC